MVKVFALAVVAAIISVGMYQGRKAWPMAGQAHPAAASAGALPARQDR